MSNALKYFAIISVENLCKKHVAKSWNAQPEAHERRLNSETKFTNINV